MENILSLLIWIPILSGLALLFFTKKSYFIDIYNIIINSLVFALSVFLLLNFDVKSSDFQFVEILKWIPSLNINYHLGVDGISTLLILLNTIIFLIVAFYNFTLNLKKRNQYYASFLIASGLTIGVFSALDAMLFYIFFEALLIPMFIIIGVWEGLIEFMPLLNFLFILSWAPYFY